MFVYQCKFVVLLYALLKLQAWKTSNIFQMIDFDHEVDASGLNCPLPLLRLKKALTAMQSGEIVRIIATDPAAHLDFGVYSDQTGNRIIEFTKESDKQTFYIKKK